MILNRLWISNWGFMANTYTSLWQSCGLQARGLTIHIYHKMYNVCLRPKSHKQKRYISYCFSVTCHFGLITKSYHNGAMVNRIWYPFKPLKICCQYRSIHAKYSTQEVLREIFWGHEPKKDSSKKRRFKGLNLGKDTKHLPRVKKEKKEEGFWCMQSGPLPC